MNHTLSKVLVGVELFMGFAAVFGGIGLIFTNGLGMPISLLLHSPFGSYFWPGVILTTIVGGSNLLAATMVIRSQAYAFEFSAIAGLGSMIWIVTEFIFVGYIHWLQPVCLVLSLITLAVTCLLQSHLHELYTLKNTR